MAIDERRGAPVETGRESPDPIDDARLVAALRRGDEAAFVTLVDRYHATLSRLAAMYVRDRAVADEVVQETWLGVLRGIDRFEGRASLRTWLARILINRAKSHGKCERRAVPFSSLGASDDANLAGSAIDPARFLPPGHPSAGHWASALVSWDEDPEGRLLSREAEACVEQAIAALPPNQRAVITLRDVEGWTAGEVCHALGLSETNQRQLLHRARSKVRRALEQELGEA